MKTNSTTPNKRKKLRIVALLVIGVAIVGGGLLLYQKHQNNQAIAKERAQYAQAEKDLDALATKITAKLGQPDDSKKVKSCGYTSSDFGTGALSCDVGNYLYYPIFSMDEATSLVSKITSLSMVLINPEKGNGSPSIASSGFELNGLKCISDYSIHSSTDNLENLGYTNVKLKNDGYGFLIQMSCGKPHPKEAYYPVKGL